MSEIENAPIAQQLCFNTNVVAHLVVNLIMYIAVKLFHLSFEETAQTPIL